MTSGSLTKEEKKMCWQLYYLADRDAYISRSKVSYSANKERSSELRRIRYYSDSPEVRAARSRRYYELNREQEIARSRADWIQNRERHNARMMKIHAKRRAIKCKATTSDLNLVKKIYDRCNELRKWFNVVVDHIIPLAKGGTHSPDNLQIIRASENFRKSARLDYKPQIIFR